MPRTRFDKRKPKRYDKILALFISAGVINGKSRSDMAPMAGVAQSTIYERFKSPEHFTLGELIGIARGLDIPIEELRQAITY